MQPFPTEPNKVLICYRRTNYKFAQKLVEQLKNRFGIDSFLDENLHKEGYEWRPVWKGQLRTQVDPRLAPGLGPTVIVIATEAAREKKQPKDIVVEEIWEALNPEPPVTDIPVVILRFGSDGWPILEARLLEKFAEPELSRAIDPADLMRRLHQPRSLPPDWVSATLGENEWLAICRPIVTNVRAYFLRTLSTERESTKAWCQMILERTLAGSDHDFLSIQPSRVTIDKAIQAFAASEDGHALAVVGSGGLGKTTQVARSVLTAIESNQSTFFPVLVSNEELTRLDYSLRKRLGVTWASQTSPLSLSDEGLYWFRNKLCFITDSLERADEVTHNGRAVGASAWHRQAIDYQPAGSLGRGEGGVGCRRRRNLHAGKDFRTRGGEYLASLREQNPDSTLSLQPGLPRYCNLSFSRAGAEVRCRTRNRNGVARPLQEVEYRAGAEPGSTRGGTSEKTAATIAGIACKEPNRPGKI